MNGQVDWSQLFFSADGRAARAPSWIAALLLLVMAAAYEALAGPTIHWITGWFAYPPLFYCGACVLSKRLHDRGRSGWWAALVLAAVVAVWPEPNRSYGFSSFFFALALVWAAVELGVMPSEHGANRYGPNPLRAPVSA
ncbi:MAG: DUF805 domain-containing protein [Phenylobacterium sp.]